MMMIESLTTNKLINMCIKNFENLYSLSPLLSHSLYLLIHTVAVSLKIKNLKKVTAKNKKMATIGRKVIPGDVLMKDTDRMGGVGTYKQGRTIHLPLLESSKS